MTAPEDDLKLFHCPALVALKVVSGKWKTRILWLLRERPFHFGDLRRRLPGVSAKVLTDQIRELEEAGVIERNSEVRNGVEHVVYAYSDYGRTLVPALDALGHWGLTHSNRMEAWRAEPGLAGRDE